MNIKQAMPYRVYVEPRYVKMVTAKLTFAEAVSAVSKISEYIILDTKDMIVKLLTTGSLDLVKWRSLHNDMKMLARANPERHFAYMSTDTALTDLPKITHLKGNVVVVRQGEVKFPMLTYEETVALDL